MYMDAPKNSVKIFPVLDENKENSGINLKDIENNQFNVKNEQGKMKGETIKKKQGLKKNDVNQNKLCMNKKLENQVKPKETTRKTSVLSNKENKQKIEAYLEQMSYEELYKGEENGEDDEEMACDLPPAEPLKTLEQMNKQKVQEKINNLPIELNPFEKKYGLEKYMKKEFFEIFNLQKNSDILLNQYGTSIFKAMKKNEKEKIIPEDFLSRHKVNIGTRSRMIDWMLEIFHVYGCKPETLFLSVHLMDCYIFRSKKEIKDEDIHLLGIGCIMLSAKYQEIFGISMQSLVFNIGHKLFTEKVILAKEQDILKNIDITDFTYCTTFDFIMTFFYDFNVNNMKFLQTTKEKKLYQLLREISIFFSIIVMHYPSFYKYRPSDVAVGCVLAAYKTITKKNIGSCDFGRLSDYCNFIRTQNETSLEIGEKLSAEIIDAKWNKYDKAFGPNGALTKFYLKHKYFVASILL